MLAGRLPERIVLPVGREAHGRQIDLGRADSEAALRRYVEQQFTVTRADGKLDGLDDADTFAAAIRKLRRKNWIVYAKPPFGGPEQVLAYLGRYTHRVAIAKLPIQVIAPTFHCTRREQCTSVIYTSGDRSNTTRQP